MSSERNIDDSDIYHLSPTKIIQSKIKILFNQNPSYRNETKTVKIQKLINDLKEKLPDDIEIDIKNIKKNNNIFKGYLLPYNTSNNVITNINDYYYQYFPVDELSINPVERFKELFQFRPNWVYDDIEPYIVYYL